MATLTFEVTGQLTAIHIQVVDGRLILEGNLLDAATGLPLRFLREDVTDLLTPTQQNYVAAIVARAQAWVAAKVG